MFLQEVKQYCLKIETLEPPDKMALDLKMVHLMPILISCHYSSLFVFIDTGSGDDGPSPVTSSSWLGVKNLIPVKVVREGFR